MPKRLANPMPEERLVAKVHDWSSSYYIGQSMFEAPIDDEAITSLRCQIVEADPRHRQHIDHMMQISLICARRYSGEKDEPGRPSLFYLTLRKNQRSLLTYLPADAFWSLPTMLSRSTHPCIEVSFERLWRGTGALRSLWVGSYEQLIQERAAIAELTRAK